MKYVYIITDDDKSRDGGYWPVATFARKRNAKRFVREARRPLTIHKVRAIPSDRVRDQ